MSVLNCGCDPEANYRCTAHLKEAARRFPYPTKHQHQLDARLTGPTGAIGTGASPVRQFETGATRDTDSAKYDYEGFLSPLVLERYAEYMHKNRIQKDGSTRDSDNWQKGIPSSAYLKSGFRHFMEWWLLHRGPDPHHGDLYGDRVEEALCALLFNVMGYLHEYLKGSKS